MKTTNLFFLIIITYLLGFFLHAAILGKTVYGDGIYYYAWLRSAVIDGDIDFRNDYALLAGNQSPTKTGLVGNIYPVGPPLFGLPSFLLTHRLVNGNGLELPYQLTVGVVGVSAALTGLVLLHNFLRRFFSYTAATAAVAGIALTTNLLFYGSLDTVNSHSLSFLAATVFLTLLVTKPIHPFLLGILAGILALIRPQDALFGILLAPLVIARSPKRWRGTMWQSLRLLRLRLAMTAKVISGFLLAFLPQLIAWQVFYGTFLKSPYLDRGYGFNILQPHLFEVLFSVKSGLILWTPIVGLALAGFVLKKFPSQINRWFCLATIAAQVYLVSVWTTWWQGASFSGRMFVSLLPVFAIGLANVFTHLQAFRFRMFHFMTIIIFPLAAINMVLTFYFLLIT